jgi:hypothetical protein
MGQALPDIRALQLIAVMEVTQMANARSSSGWFVQHPAVLPICLLVGMVAVLYTGALQMPADSSLPRMITCDAPGGGTTASALEGTAAFSNNSAGVIVGFETDPSQAHNGFDCAAEAGRPCKRQGGLHEGNTPENHRKSRNNGRRLHGDD